MRYSNETSDQIYVRGYVFLSFVKNMGSKYEQKLLDTTKMSATDALKTLSKEAIQRTAEGTGDLIGDKIVEKIM